MDALAPRPANPERSRGPQTSTLSAFGGGMVVAVAIVATIAGLTDSPSWLTALDERAALWASVHITGPTADVVTLVTYLGATVTIILVAAATALYAWRRTGQWQIPAFLLAVALGQSLVNNAIKLTVERPRPIIAPVVQLETWSFPSGHATAAAATYLAIALVLGNFAGKASRALLIGGGIVLAVAIAVSRVMLGVHWFSDVVAGLLTGWTWFALCLVAFGAIPSLRWQLEDEPGPTSESARVRPR